MADNRLAVDDDLDAQAFEALKAARAMPYGHERALALKRAGLLRKAADDARGEIAFPRVGRPRKANSK
jgi:hypothetical protein